MYSARITRDNPTAFIFMIDRSGSMEEKMNFGQSLMTKSEVVAMVTNMLIRELINRCRKEDGIMDYFDIAAIGYSGNESAMLLGTHDTFVKPSVLAHSDCSRKIHSFQREMPDGRCLISNDELKYWIEPKAEGNTPMLSALETALALVGKWCKRGCNAASYPPTIFNITDGEATDGDHPSLTAICEQIKSLATEDGNVLLININISSGFSDRSILFPVSASELPGCRYSRMLYDMSSEMPAPYNEIIAQARPGVKPPFRGMSFNSTAQNLITMMNIGSRSINKIL